MHRAHPRTASLGTQPGGRGSVGLAARAEVRTIEDMPRKVRELIADLLGAGFRELSGAGKGSHRKYVHPRYLGAVTLSGAAGDDAKPYQEKQVKRAIEEVEQ
jgi:predicted RNA binding protein YcfA (HicA-like mRNA interferase family)